MEPRLTIVTLGVADLARSRAFYLDGLGWTAIEQPSDEIVFIQMASMVLSLYPLAALAEDIGIEPREASIGNGGITLAHNTASKEETDQAMATALAAGASLVKEPQEVFWGGYSGYFADPDGHLWEVAFNPYKTPGEDGSFVM